MFLLSRFTIHGHSMEPTIIQGETVLVSKIPYWFFKPKVGDTIVIKIRRKSRHSGKQSASRIKLIPKRTERFWTSQNDEENSKYLVKRIAKIDTSSDGEKYFVKGDNEKDSLDSRGLGWIGRKEIVGKVIYGISNVKNQISNLHLKS